MPFQHRGKFFVASNLFSLGALPAHNSSLSGDSLTSLTLNYKWRSLIAAAVEFYYRDYFDTADELDNQDALVAFLEDLYSYEVIGSTVATKTKSFELSADITTTSTTFTSLIDLNFSYTITKKNVLVKWTVFLVNSGANNSYIRPTVNGATGADSTIGRNNGSTGRTVVVADRFENLALGNKTFSLDMRASTGTARINSTFNVILEIYEYD